MKFNMKGPISILDTQKINHISSLYYHKYLVGGFVQNQTVVGEHDLFDQ